MGLFRYEAVDKTGKVVRGVMNAADEQQVAQKLGGMGYSARSVYSPGAPQQSGQPGRVQTAASPSQPKAGKGRGIQSVTLASGVPVSIKSSVSPAALAVFFRQLATLVRSGRPIYQSISDLSVSNKKLRAIIPDFQERVQNGGKLSSVMADNPDVFPVHTVSSVWCGELAGKLEYALDEVATDFEQESSETRLGKVGWFMTKLTIITGIFMLPMCNLENLLLPAATQALTAPGTGPGEVLRSIGQTYMQTMFWKSVIISSSLIAAWIVFGFIKRVPAAKRAMDGLILMMPVWGKLHRYRALARFTHVLDGLYAAGIPPATAWEAASLSPRNSAIAEKLRLTRNANIGTGGVASMFAASGVFDADDIGLASAGEKSGQLPDVLSRISTVYANKADMQRTVGRTVSIHLLIIFSLVLGGYMMISMAKTYFDVQFKIGDLIGL